MIDIDSTLARGGAARVALLRYCVISITMEPLFLFIAGEYRLRPTHAGALALYDVFCSPQSDSRLAAHDLLPPRELALSAEIGRIRERWAALQAAPVAGDDSPQRRIAESPSRALFDTLSRGVRSDASGTLQSLAAAYDPQRTPEENLPGGRMTEAQRRFADRVWQRNARPRLVAAGFWQVATVG